jgi:predicted HTH transcriptional regulator
MDWTTLLDVMRKGESAHAQFVPHYSRVEDIAPTIVAMANGTGGDIVLGIDLFNYHLVGAAFDRQALIHHLEQNCDPVPIFRHETVTKNEKNLHILHVPDQDKKPYSYHRRCLLREGAQNRLASVEEEESLRELAAERALHTPAHAPQPAMAALEDWVTDNPDSESRPNTPLNARQEQALFFLSRNANISNRAYRDLFKVSHKTAHLELVDLVEKGWVVSQGLGRSTCYALPHALVTAAV